METRYAVRYWSESKGREIALEEMHDQHLVNALAKARLDRQWYEPDLLRALEGEVKRRGLDRPKEGK